MKLKSYFSGTVEAAMQLARKELGEEALLVHARPATPETRALGAFEVVFGVVPAGSGTHRPAVPVPMGIPAGVPTGMDDLLRDVHQLRREFAQMTQAIHRQQVAPSPASAASGDIPPAWLESELDGNLLTQLKNGAALTGLFTTDSTLGKLGAQRAVVALVGPPGVGKTTTLVKLAARYGLTSRRPAHILTTDVFRIAAADQLRTLAGILGIGCTVAETPLALAQALEELRTKHFVFIDTPGLGIHDLGDGAELARLLAGHAEIDTHLVLPASMKAADLARVLHQYQIFRPAKLLFTRIDETQHCGGLINASARHGLPISFLATGQQIPDDLQPANSTDWSALVFGAIETFFDRNAKSLGASA